MATAYHVLGIKPRKLIVQSEMVVSLGMLVGKQISPHSSIACRVGYVDVDRRVPGVSIVVVVVVSLFTETLAVVTVVVVVAVVVVVPVVVVVVVVDVVVVVVSVVIVSGIGIVSMLGQNKLVQLEPLQLVYWQEGSLHKQPKRHI